MSPASPRAVESATPEWPRKVWHWLSRVPSCCLSWGVFLGFLALYSITLSPDVLPADAGEFQRVTVTAGVAHPPGYPLYTMLGWLFSHLPVGPTPAWRVSLFSAVTTAATVALLFSAAREVTDSVLGGTVAALALGSATTVWATATTASIRPLTAFFTTLCLYAVIRHNRQIQEGRGGADDGYVVLFSLSLSLGLTHHPSLLFPGTVFLVYLLMVDPDLVRQPRRWIRPLVALLPGLLVLAYLPLRGGARLRTLSGFLDHVLARGFRGDMFALSLLDRLVLLPTLLRFQFNAVLLVGMCLGALGLLWKDRRLALLLIGSFVVHTAVTLTYDAPQTVEYAIPAYVSLVLLLAAPLGLLGNRASPISQRQSPLSSVAPAALFAWRVGGMVLLLGGILNLTAHFPSYRQLSWSYDTRNYVRRVLRGAPPDAIILSNWHWFTPLRYSQAVEGARPDVKVEYVAPAGEPLARTWVRKVEEHVGQRPVIVTRFFEQEYRPLPYRFEPIGEAFVVRPEARRDVPSDLVAVDAVLGDEIRLRGFRAVTEEARPGQTVTVELAWSLVHSSSEELALFAQLIGPEGGLWSAAEDPRHELDNLSPGDVILDRIVVYPLVHAPPGAYRLVIGAYSSEGRLRTAEGSDVVTLESVELRASTSRPVTQHPLQVRIEGGPRLIGVDYDLGVEGDVRTYLHWAGPGDPVQIDLLDELNTTIAGLRVPGLERGEYATLAVDGSVAPSRLSTVNGEGMRRWNIGFGRAIRLPSPRKNDRYVPFNGALILVQASRPTPALDPGAEVTLPLRFRGQGPLQRDYIVSTSLTGLRDDDSWAWRASHDTVPALGAMPTLKWIRGSTVKDPHLMSVPDHAPPDVPVVGSLVIYDHFTQARLTHLDERLGAVVEVGTWPARP